MTTIFNYLDYRAFLKDALKERKQNNSHFSYRFISNYLNLKSPGFINWVIQGKKRLPESLVPKIADLFKLEKQEREFLAILVKYNHCADIAERQWLFKQLSGFYKKQLKELLPRQEQLFAQWYYLAVRELLRVMQFKDDYQGLAQLLRPKIKTKEARDAISILKKIGLVVQDKDSFIKPNEALVTTKDAWESELITNLQIQLADMGKNSIVTIPKHQRDISNLTFCASDGAMKTIALEIAQLREKILQISENDSDADKVYQCNFQLFPISQKCKGARQ
jgi:uncharacterized protein (TIGR02147 family)